MRRRIGFSTLLIIIPTAALMMIWGIAQQITTLNVRQKVLIAQAQRQCRLAATTALEEGVSYFSSEVNEAEEEGGGSELAGSIRALQPGQTLHFGYDPTRTGAQEATGVELTAIEGTAFLVSVSGGSGERPPSFDCGRYRDFLFKWSAVPG